MTEAEWMNCTDPTPMLGFLRSSGKLSERKARLFAVACSRNVWPWMRDERSRQAVEVCERYAEGLVGQKALNAVRRQAFAASKSPVRSSSSQGYAAASEHAAIVALNVCMSTKRHDCQELAMVTADCASSLVAHVLGDAAEMAERKSQCALIRCLFGKPFRSISISHAILNWNEGTVRKIAQGIYEDRVFDHLPILADALEEAGCTNPDILGHCRSGDEHVRGCWVIDALLGKQ